MKLSTTFDKLLSVRTEKVSSRLWGGEKFLDSFSISGGNTALNRKNRCRKNIQFRAARPLFRHETTEFEFPVKAHPFMRPISAPTMTKFSRNSSVELTCWEVKILLHASLWRPLRHQLVRDLARPYQQHAFSLDLDLVVVALSHRNR